MNRVIGRVAVVGLGRMGVPMALNLSRRGLELRSWNRSPRAPDILRGLHCQTGAPASAVDGADLVVLALSDAAAIEAVLFDLGAARALSPGAVVADMGTTGPKAACRHAERLARLGVAYLDAPVSGGVAGAEAGALTIMVGGDREVFDRCAPVLSAMGRPHLMGPVGAGQAAKLANQMIVAGYIAAVAEGVRFAEDLGLSGGALVDALEGGFADSAILRRHGRKMVTRDFSPGGTCRLHLKDLGLAADLATPDVGRFANTAEALRRFERLVAAGQGDADHSAYFQTYEVES